LTLLGVNIAEIEVEVTELVQKGRHPVHLTTLRISPVVNRGKSRFFSC